MKLVMPKSVPKPEFTTERKLRFGFEDSITPLAADYSTLRSRASGSLRTP